MKPITINELAPLLDTPRFTGGVLATKTSRMATLVAALGIALAIGFGTGAWGAGATTGISLAFICLLWIPTRVRKRYAAELIDQGLPGRIAYLYKKYKGGNGMAKWIDRWYEDFNNGCAMTPSQMLVILQHTWSSAYGGLSEKRSRLKEKNLSKTQAFNKSMSNGRQSY